MPQSIAAPSGRQAASLVTGALLGAGVALYQITSLVLAPASDQRISLSLRTGGQEPAILIPPGRGPSLDRVLAVSSRSAAVEPDAGQRSHLRPSSSIGSSPARRPAPPASPSLSALTPVDPPVAARVDSEKHNRHGGDGRWRERD